MLRSFALFAASLATAAALGQSSTATLSAQDSQVAYREMLCGNEGLPPTSTEIPTVGCFAVPSGGTARGLFDGHQFIVAVDTRGEPQCRLDAATAECAGCIGQNVPECPVRLVVVSHNADQSVSFSVQRKADGNRYLFRIDAWNRYLEMRQTRREVEAAQAPATAPIQSQAQFLTQSQSRSQTETQTQTQTQAQAQTQPPAWPPKAPAMRPMLPPSASSPMPPPPPGMLPGSIAPTDGPVALAAIGFKVQGAYGAGQFSRFDELMESVSQPDQLTDDGMPQAIGVTRGLWDFLYQWKSWQSDLDKIAEWRKEYPDSYGADFAEATLWRAWGWNARGENYASTVTPEGWRLFGEKIAHADAVLERSKPRASKSPLYYQLRLGVARDANWERKRYMALYSEATQRFPWYIPFYLSAANYLSPKWGGTYEDVDRLARRTTATPLGSDYSLYTRIYWDLSDQEAPEFEPFRDSLADWPLMKRGFEGLMKRYPKSKWNLNAYAYFACRANDGPTYGVLRARIGQDVIPSAWASSYPAEVCDARLLDHT